MIYKLNILLVFCCFNVYADAEYGKFDHDIKSVSTEIDEHVIVDDKGNSQRSSIVHPKINDNADAMSGTARFFSLFDQNGNVMEALSERVEKQVNR